MLTLLHMAWRNIFRNGRRSGILIATIAIGIVGTALSDGMTRAIGNDVIDLAIQSDVGHLQIHAQGYLDDPKLARLLPDGASESLAVVSQDSEIAAYARRIHAQALATSASTSVGLNLVGIDAEREPTVSSIADWVIEGDFLSGKPREAVVGEALAERLRLGLGKKLVVASQDKEGDMVAIALRIRGLYRAPSADFERSRVFVNLDTAMELLRTEGGVNEVAILTESTNRAHGIQSRLAAQLTDVEIHRWDEVVPSLASLSGIISDIMWGFYAIIFLAMAFGIANVMFMSVMDRVREIGVMRAIGLSRARLIVLILFEGLLTTIAGTVVGFVIALIISAAIGDGIRLDAYEAGMRDVGLRPILRSDLSAMDFIPPVVVAAVTGILSSAWPAMRAARLQPAEATRHT